MRLALLNMFKPSSRFYWPFQWGAFFVGPFCYLCFSFVFVIQSCLFLAPLWLPAGKWLTSEPSCASADPEGGLGVRIQIQIPWKSQLPSQHSMLSHHRHASETPFNGDSLAGRWWSAYSGTWILKKKNHQSWTPSDKTFWIRACCVWCFLVVFVFFPIWCLG